MAPTSDPTDHARRLEELERYVSNQGNSISEITKAHGALSGRVDHLESLAQERAITEAREDERDKALYDRLDRMEKSIEVTNKDIKDLRGIGAKALWVFISAIIVAAAAFVVKGGLA